MDKKLILDYEELPQDKTRIKWGSVILEKEAILWQGKPADKLEHNILREILFFLLNAIFVICLVMETRRVDPDNWGVLFFTLLLILPFVYFYMLKNYAESKTEYVITDKALMFRLFHNFSLKTFQIPLKEITRLSLEKFHDTATIHLQTSTKPKFTTHNIIGGAPQYHPTIEHVKNYDQAFELLKEATDQQKQLKREYHIPLAPKKSLNILRYAYYVILFVIGAFMLSYYFLPNLAFWNLNPSYSLEVRVANLMAVSISKILVFTTYGIIMLLLFTLLNRDMCPRDDLKAIIFLPILFIVFIFMLAYALDPFEMGM